jgi:ubiquinol-cytochrome c reductase iron-sulfur subunit
MEHGKKEPSSMAHEEEEKKGVVTRRDFLTIVTGAFGAVGVAGAAYPFIRVMSPTKDLIAAGVMAVDIKKLKVGELKTVIWRKQPIFILRRTDEMIKKAEQIDPETLRDPSKPEERAKRPDLFVCIAICTHLGCIPKFRPERVEGTDMPGFYCPCHAGRYDTLGRTTDGPPPENLHLLPYELVNDNKIVLGTERFAGYGENVRKIKDLPKLG